MHLHFVQNQTPQRRVVLFGDVPRYDVPFYVWVAVELIHLLVAPFVSEIQKTISFNHWQLTRGGLHTHFVRRHAGQSAAVVLCIAAPLLVVGLLGVGEHLREIDLEL